MKVNKSDIKREVLNCLKGKEVNESKLDLFVSDFAEAINTLFQDREGSEEEAVEREISEREWKFDKSKHESMLRKFQSFKRFFKENKECLVDKNDFLPVLSHLNYYLEQDFVYETGEKREHKYILREGVEFFDEYLGQLEKGLEMTIGLLESSLEIRKPKAGRRIDHYRPYFIRKVFVMEECLLGLETPNTRNTSPFNEVLSYGLTLTGDNSDKANLNFPRLLKCCFYSYGDVLSLSYIYEKYGRLDLFHKHLSRTEYEEEIVEEWGCYFWVDYLKEQGIRQ